MLLKKLETRGFKSFAEKLTIEFGQGITAIVGPNGSGKSNITDAIRWVLGEQNMRTLRGAKSEDIIFSGTSQGRRPLGMAEVSITLDNSDRKIPLDYSEIEIMRRVFRSGENEYYLNRNSCRLKDIQEILFGTGMGKNNLSVIGQNKVDEILNSKPEERRLIFEEAAGIAKYKQRKKESLRKLEDTNQNLIRIEDVTAELEGQLPALKVKAENTEKYLDLARQRTEVQEILLFHKMNESERLQAETLKEQEAMQGEMQDLSAQITILDVEQMKQKEALSACEAQIETVSEAVSACQTMAEHLQGQVAILTERIAQNQAREMLFREDSSRVTAQQAEQKLRKEQIVIELAEILKEQASITEKTQEKQNERDQSANVLRKQEEDIEGVRAEIFALKQKIGIAEEKMRYQAESSRSFQEWHTAWQETITELEEDIAYRQSEIERLSEEAEKHKQLREEMQRQKREMDMRLIQDAKRVQLLKTESLTYEKEYHAVHSRYAVLAGMQKEYEGFSRAGKQILSQKARWNNGVYGAVAELIEMDGEVVTAIETALGASLQNIVVDTDTTAKQIIEYLKQQNLGRATFLPLNGLQVYPTRSQEESAAKENGAVGIASELVRCDERYRRVIAFLLNRTVIVRTMDDAVRIARKYGHKVRLITLDGDIINSGGSMTGGSRMRKEAGFLSRSLELAELKQKQEEVSVKRAENEALLNEANRAYEALRVQYSQQAQKEIRWQQQANELQMQKEKTKFAETQLVANLAERRREGELRIAAYEESQVTDARVQDDISKWQAEVIEQEEGLAKLTAEREAMQTYQAELDSALIQCQVALTSLGERTQFLEQEDVRITAEIQNGELRKQEISAELENLHKVNSEQTIEKENCTEKQKEKQNELAALMAKKEAHQKERFMLFKQIEDHEAIMKQYRKEESDLSAKLHRIEMQYAKHQYECARNQENLDALGIASFAELETKVAGYDNQLSDVELMPTLRKLERAIQALGPINPNAIEEYKELEERFTFLQKQQADLLEAKTYLTDVIEQIDRVMEKNFAKAFHEIDGHFRTIFARIFGGGQARLELTDRSEMLTTGIEIIAQPPGKKQQNMVLLSGGERALTVIALLFAFLKYRPMPFTVVDEIDAPLDEANLERFVSFLKEFAKETQFIIVTHRKVTMRAADVMHGVTNEDAGVSRIISVKMQDIE
ncbi:MAG: chromosome segregation protein SMC [Selenomonadales bacterium]|nr:chromosome segregation protein SMC [Selenomonadales bacterium]